MCIKHAIHPNLITQSIAEGAYVWKIYPRPTIWVQLVIKPLYLDSLGKVKASYFSGYATDYLRPNWAEQNPEDWWQGGMCIDTPITGNRKKSNQEKSPCVSLCGHMMGCVAVDRQANPLRTAIIYADTRAVEETQKLIEKVGMEPAYRITGHRTNSFIIWRKDDVDPAKPAWYL